MDIAKVDKNFAIETNIEREGLTFFKVGETEVISVHGVFFEGGCFRRMPMALAESLNPNVVMLNQCTAGGRVRFVTDSPYIAISVKWGVTNRMTHMPHTGSIGFDLYLDEKFYRVFSPPYEVCDGYESVWDVPVGRHSVVINMPLFSGIKELYIGIKAGSELSAPKPYSIEKPIVYYGSSITNGACASRPGNSYENIISRELSAEQINLGFSGNAKGEKEMAEYIAGLSMSLFVYDYDHNAPTVEHLRNTHYPFYKIIREKNPQLPIIILSRPQPHLTEVEKERLSVIKETYEKAKREGDENVYFIPGPELISKEAANTCTVDDAHPNDSGFLSMATVLINQIRQILR